MNNEASRKAFEAWCGTVTEKDKSLSNRRDLKVWNASRKALEAEQAQTVEPVATSIRRNRTAKEFKFGMDVLNWNRAQTDPPIDAGRELWVSDEVLKLLTHPAPQHAEPTGKQPLSTERAALIARLFECLRITTLTTREATAIKDAADMLEADVQGIDWQDMYRKQKSEKEAMVAKYEKDIGPLEKVFPAKTAQQVAVPAWMPIETAPKDGQCLLWVDTDDGGEVMTLLRDSNGCWLYEGKPVYSASFYIEPTHWMPLPQPPQGDKT